MAGLAPLSASPVEGAVLTTIAIDGSFGDWTPVLADPGQTALDGPAGGLLDLDAPVPSTGRDLTTFAWTYDATHLFFLVGRVASESNRQRFWFYLDTNENDRMETGEPVVLVSWFGSTRRTDVELWRYAAAAPGGDPLGDPLGRADGWTMPGLVSFDRALESTNGGEATGVRMESRVAWTALGAADPIPLRFHVSSSNSTNLPAQVHDNMAGPGGLVGSTRISGVLLDPDRAGSVSSPGRVVFAHAAVNTGSSSEAFRLSWTGSGSFAPSSVGFFLDANSNGLLDPADPPATDTDGDGFPDTGPVAAGATIPILVDIAVPAALSDAATSTVVVRASSRFSPSIFDTATDVVTVSTPAVTLVKSADRGVAAPGDAITYTVLYTGAGSATALSVAIEDAVPAPTVYVPGSASGAGMTITYSRDGGATYGPIEDASVTHIRWLRPVPLAPGASGTVTFQVRVP